MNCSDPEILAERLNNHQRTSSKSGILKTDAFFQYLAVFRELEIETYQDVFIDTTRRDNLELMLRRIKGQNVAVDYFFMLAGNTDDVKVDTWIRRFVRDAVGENDLTPEQIKQLFTEAVNYYRKHGYPDITARHLDHIVWSWQKSR